MKTLCVKSIVHTIKNGIKINIENITFAAGKLYMILGENGSGKTTFLRSLIGLNGHQKVTWDGKVISKMNQQQRSNILAMCPQNPPVTYSFTGKTFLESAQYGCKYYGDVTNDIYKTFSLHSLMDKAMCDMSGGERKRLFLARTFLRHSDVLIFDEPLENLDLHFQRIFFQQVKKTLSQGKTIIFTNHNFLWIDDFEANVIVIENGICIKSGHLSSDETKTFVDEYFGLPKKEVEHKVIKRGVHDGNRI